MGALQVCDTQRKLLVFQLYELESLRSHCVQKAWAADMRRLSFILHRSTAALRSAEPHFSVFARLHSAFLSQDVVRSPGNL